MINVFRLISNEDSIVATISEKNANHKQVIMGADEIAVSIVVPEVLDVKDGDYIYHRGIKYTQNRDVDYTKFSDVNYDYTLLFEHPFYRFLDKIFTFQMTGSAVFTLTGKLVDFVDAVCWNMNYHATNNPRGIDSGWIRGSVVDTDYLTITFSSVSCRDAINQIATAFNAEFFFSGDGKTINFVDHIENETGLIFVQGRGNGLYSVSQQNVDSKDTITRVYPVGGNKNVPNAYADEDGNLKLPELYLQNTTEYNRIVEKRVVFEDVFPHFIGDVESVSGADNIEIVCSDIDFDLNQIAVGDNARINFLTGALMGISFQFQFDFAAKKITLIPQNDDTALVNDDGTIPQVPRSTRKAAVTDKFNFTGVVMPVQYVNAAITKLREKGTSWLSFYSRKRVKFGLEIDYRWMRNKQVLNPGDLVTVQIPERGIDKTIRISELNTRIYDGQLNAIVSNYRDENWQKKVEGAISSLQTTVSGGGVGGGVDILERYDARPSSDRNVMSSLRSEKNFLKKDTEDVASERITFDKGAVVRDLATKDFEQGKFLGAGAGIFEDELGNSVIEVDKLHVRKEAWFNEIVINQIRFQGGIVVYSAATLEVLSVTDGGSYLQVYFDTKNGQLANQFAVDDQIRCQRFSGGNVIKYYMSRVTSIGTDFIRLSKTDIDGTLNVEVGDAIVQFGNRTNTGRQSLIEVNVLDGGKQTFYQNVNSYSLTNKNYLELGRVLVDGEWKNMIRSFGGAYVGNRDLSSYIKYNEITGKVEIKASVEFLGTDGSYKSVEQAIDEVEVGGRNLVLNSKAARSSSYVAYNEFISTPLVVGKSYIVTAKCNRIPEESYMRKMSTGYNLSQSFSLNVPFVATDVWDMILIAGTDILISEVQLEQGNKATDWSPAPEDIQLQIDETNSYIEAVESDLQNQIDGQIIAWFKEYNPTLINEPASLWATADEKNRHANDTFTNTLTGASWRWQYSGGAWQWGVIADTATQQALLAASKAQDTADSKRRTFTAQPLTSQAYDVGDLWVNATVGTFTNDLLKCKTAKAVGVAFNVAHWEKASKYTDDTAVQNLKPAGKNYLINSRTDSLVGWGAYGGTMSVVTDAQYGKVVEYSRPAGGSDFMKSFTIDTSELKNTELVYYCIAKPISGTTIFNFGGWTETFTMLNNNSPYRDLGSGWRMYYKVFTAGSAINSGGSFGLNSVGGTWRFHSFGVAKGNTPPADWDASPREIDFLKQGYQASTDIEGGVVQTAVLLLRNALEQVTAGISGLGGDNVINWGAGTYQQAIDDAAKAFGAAMLTSFLNKDDGGGHLAFGKIAWDNAGQLLVRGAIEALSGQFGLLKILGTSIIGDHLKITDEAIDSKATATGMRNYTIPSKTELRYMYKNAPTQQIDSNVVTIESPTTISYARGTYGYGEMYLYSDDPADSIVLSTDCTCIVRVTIQCLNNGNVIASANSAYSIIGVQNGSYKYPDNLWGASLSNIAVSAGTVMFRMIATISDFFPSAAWIDRPAIRLPMNMRITADGSSARAATNLTVSAYVKRTMLGGDGLYNFANANRYVYWRGAGDANDIFEVRLNNSILKMTETYFDIPAGLGGASISGTGSVFANWGKIDSIGKVVKSGSNYTITHNIGDTNYSLILTPISTNVPYFSSKSANTVVVTCAGGFDFVLIRTK